MNALNIADNIIRLRHEKKITQEELADFAGVTKASVSKWENRQSMPDILLLPLLASFFDVTVDELLGYEPQLSKEQIQKIYQGLAADFAVQPFDEVMERSRKLVRQYYSCYPFLFQMAALWLNHSMLAGSPERQSEILEEASLLCSRIARECRDIGISSDAVILRAFIDLQTGKVAEVIEALEETLNPYRFTSQSENILIQAYQMAGEYEKADGFTQVSMYLHLANLVTDAVCYLELHREDLQICRETVRRIDMLDDAYHLSRLQANVMAQFQLQSAIVFCAHGEKEEALGRLRQFAGIMEWMLAGEHLKEYGDAYFTRLSQWIENSDLGGSVPRDKKVIRASAAGGLSHPAFEILAGEPEFRRIRAAVERAGEARR